MGITWFMVAADFLFDPSNEFAASFKIRKPASPISQEPHRSRFY